MGFGDRSMGRGILGAIWGRTIVTNADFTAYVCDSAATRPSSQITLGRLLTVTSNANKYYIFVTCVLCPDYTGESCRDVGQ